MPDTTDTLRDIFPKVLEKQVFMFAEEIPLEEAVAPDLEWVEARISFHGPFTGALSMAIPREIEYEIAANFLGKDADDPAVAACADDSLKEILNVVCGHMLTALAGETPVFDLSIPSVVPLTGEAREDLAAQPGALGFDVEGKPAILRFQSGEMAPAPGKP